MFRKRVLSAVKSFLVTTGHIRMTLNSYLHCRLDLGAKVYNWPFSINNNNLYARVAILPYSFARSTNQLRKPERYQIDHFLNWPQFLDSEVVSAAWEITA